MAVREREKEHAEKQEEQNVALKEMMPVTTATEVMKATMPVTRTAVTMKPTTPLTRTRVTMSTFSIVECRAPLVVPSARDPLAEGRGHVHEERTRKKEGKKGRKKKG